ncbi:MAG: hypothetical protein ABSF15_11970 [Candidatus Sulfotelmatobacter sp.]|jgi:predicted transcriptional regulator
MWRSKSGFGAAPRPAKTRTWAHYQVTGRHVTAEEADAWLAKLAAGKDAAPPKCRA